MAEKSRFCCIWNSKYFRINDLYGTKLHEISSLINKRSMLQDYANSDHGCRLVNTT